MGAKQKRKGKEEEGEERETTTPRMAKMKRSWQRF